MSASVSSPSTDRRSGDRQHGDPAGLVLLVDGQHARVEHARARELPLTLNSRGPGVYNGKAVLRTATDVRVHAVQATVAAPGTRATLEFACPIKHSVVQEVPVVNNSAADWTVRAALSGEIGALERRDYPEPLVDHKKQQASFKALYATIRS